MNKVVKAIAWLILFAALVAGVVVLYRYTNGFNEEFKTFYIERDGEKVLAAESSQAFEAGSELRYDVCYTFDGLNAEVRDYGVEILPNPKADFDFKVDETSYAWRMADGLESYFSLDKQASFFTLKVPSYHGIADCLRTLYAGELDLGSLPEEEEERAYFLLRVSSYNGAVTYNIEFSVVSRAGDYTIEFSSTPGGNSWMTKVLCPDRANAGETVTFSWEWSSESPYQTLESVSVQKENGEAVELLSGGGWRFVMPAANVRILVTYGRSAHGG